ncbi:hypothetical protein [Solirubrum puertoriconensis]|uniref:Uncharacterized protein n=1 Tax=Solirubrum puertoriconensis TaxID=1751427 RepID=A0A9X0HK57_SOLP1|nr:hypothetical protein [Solirubrum puertoriconensis]KUG07353.1 hypothetical protein ASU33_13425 [Solirubrum puertoriconensis]
MLWIWALSWVLLWYNLRQWRRALPERRRVQALFVLLAAAWLVLLGLWVIVPLVASWIGEASLHRR